MQLSGPSKQAAIWTDGNTPVLCHLIEKRNRPIPNTLAGSIHFETRHETLNRSCTNVGVVLTPL